MPTPPESPTPSLCDDSSSSPDPSVEAADIVIGRRLTVKGADHSHRFIEDAASPTCPAFVMDGTFSRKKAAMNPSGFVRTHTPSSSLDSIKEANEMVTQLPPQPFREHRSASDSKVSVAVSEDLVSPRTLIKARNDSFSARSTRSVFSDRSERTTSISEAIRELNGKWNVHFERYTKLRQCRQLLHSEILSDLQNNQPKPNGAKTPLQMQLEMASMDAAIDDCVAKMGQVDKRRQKLVEELVAQVQSQPQTQQTTPTQTPTTPVRRGHARNESVGIQEMIPMPHSPPLPSALPSLAAQVASARLPDRWFEKKLPQVPPHITSGGEVRLSSNNSLSLASVMEFLDASDPEMGMA